jgi:hypothetical protein
MNASAGVHRGDTSLNRESCAVAQNLQKSQAFHRPDNAAGPPGTAMSGASATRSTKLPRNVSYRRRADPKKAITTLLHLQETP